MTTFFFSKNFLKKSNYDLKIKLIVNSQIEKKQMHGGMQPSMTSSFLCKYQVHKNWNVDTTETLESQLNAHIYR